jgi:hypothetical protein
MKKGLAADDLEAVQQGAEQYFKAMIFSLASFQL